MNLPIATPVTQGPRSALLFAADGGPCAEALLACAAAAESARPHCLEDAELASALAECALLCRTVREAMAIGARSERELRLACGSVCQLAADLALSRGVPWSNAFADAATACADACRALAPRVRIGRVA